MGERHQVLIQLLLVENSGADLATELEGASRVMRGGSTEELFMVLSQALPSLWLSGRIKPLGRSPGCPCSSWLLCSAFHRLMVFAAIVGELAQGCAGVACEVGSLCVCLPHGRGCIWLQGGGIGCSTLLPWQVVGGPWQGPCLSCAEPPLAHA